MREHRASASFPVSTNPVCSGGLPEAAIPRAPNASTRWSYPYAARRLLSITVSVPSAWRSVTTTVSRSPTSPIAGSTRTSPRAKTSSTSLPVTKRAMSRSCTVMSRNMPPETRT